MSGNLSDGDLAKIANCLHPHMQNDGFCPSCGSTVIGYTTPGADQAPANKCGHELYCPYCQYTVVGYDPPPSAHLAQQQELAELRRALEDIAMQNDGYDADITAIIRKALARKETP